MDTHIASIPDQRAGNTCHGCGRPIQRRSSDGVLSVDPHGAVTSINAAALVMVGLARESEALGRPIADVVVLRAPDGRPVSWDEIGYGAVCHVLKDDANWSKVRVETISAPHDGATTLVLRDTTREQEWERRKTEFLFHISHELRTPLTPIRGYLDFLASRPNMSADLVSECVEKIREQTLRMGRVVDLLVDLAALEAGRVKMRPLPTRVDECMEQKVAQCVERYPTRSKDISLEIEDGLPDALVDPMWIARAFDELMDNAAMHTATGSPIVAGAYRTGDHAVRVFVRGTYSQLAPSQQPSIFMPFASDDAESEDAVGTGVGLSLVRRVAEAAGLELGSVIGQGAVEASELFLDLPVD